MTSYKLQYFNARGRAEPCRLLFAAAGQEYVDERLTGQQWKEYKPNTRLGGLPILCVTEGGKTKQVSQSMAIVRHLARIFGLDGKNPWDKALVDEILETYIDFLGAKLKIFGESDAAKKDELRKKLKEEVRPKYIKTFEDILKENNGGTGFFVGDSLTVADIMVYAVFEQDIIDDATVLDKNPTLKAHRNRIAENPKIAKWLKERPET